MTGIVPKKDPTASEAMFFFAIVKHTKNKADIDWTAVATEQGFKNADVAKVGHPSPNTKECLVLPSRAKFLTQGSQVRFGQVKRKLGINDPATARTPTKTGVASGRVTKTPTKRGATKSKKSPKLEEDDGEEDHATDFGADMASPATPIKSPKSPTKTESFSDAENYVDPADFMDI